MNKKILITGGSGFIGRSLIEHFNTECFFPLRKNIWAPNSKELDLLDTAKVSEYLDKHKFDIIIHAATYDAVPDFSTKDVSVQLQNNLRMYFNLVRHSDSYEKMIYFGSGAVYDREHLKSKMSEEYFDTHVPEDQYGFSKYIMSTHTNLSNNIYNLRIFGVFGQFDDWRYRFVSNACAKAALGMPITIKQNVFFDYVYVKDLCRMAQWLIDNDSETKIMNASSGNPVDYISIANAIREISGKDLEILIEKKGLRQEYSGTNHLLVDTMKDFSYTDIEDALCEMYEWYKTHSHLLMVEHFAY